MSKGQFWGGGEASKGQLRDGAEASKGLCERFVVCVFALIGL